MKKKTLTVNNNQQELEQIQGFIENLGKEWKLNDSLVFTLNLVLEEYISNLISYGYTDQLPHQITIEVSKLEDAIRICVMDDGNPFDLTKVADITDIDSPLEERKIGGLGIHFIKSLSSNVLYDTVDGINRMRITFETKDFAQ